MIKLEVAQGLMLIGNTEYGLDQMLIMKEHEFKQMVWNYINSKIISAGIPMHGLDRKNYSYSQAHFVGDFLISTIGSNQDALHHFGNKARYQTKVISDDKVEPLEIKHAHTMNEADNIHKELVYKYYLKST